MVRFLLPVSGCEFDPWLGAGTHSPRSQNTKAENRSSVMANSIKTLRIIYIKKILKKKPPQTKNKPKIGEN